MEGEGYLVAKQKCFHIVNSDTTYIACRKMNVSFSPFSFSFVLFPLRRFFFFSLRSDETGDERERALREEVSSSMQTTCQL